MVFCACLLYEYNGLGAEGHCVVICVQAYSTVQVQKDDMPTQAASLAHLGLL